MRLGVLPSRFEEAWSGGEVDVPVFPQVPLAEALEARYDTDAMLCGYIVQGNDVQPRLGLGALAELEALGQGVVLTVAFVDLDREGHAPWFDPADAEDALIEQLSQLPEELHAAGGYSTRAGLRLVLPLDPPLPARYANGFLRALHERVQAVPGLEVDASSPQWTRLFRAPFALRDSARFDATVLYPEGAVDPYELLDAWDVVPTVEDTRAQVISEDLPEEPLDLTFDDWVAAYCHPYLKVGKPFSPRDGHVYPVVREVLASVAAVGKITDAHKLLSLVWASVSNTPDLQLSEVWRLAQWVATRQAEADARRAELPDIPPTPAPKATLEDWERVKPYFRGENKKIYRRLRDGLALTTRKDGAADAISHAASILTEKARVPSPEVLYAYLYPSTQAMAPHSPTTQELWKLCKTYTDDANLTDDNEARARLFCQEYPLTIKVVGAPLMFQLDTRRTPPCYQLTDPTSLCLHFDTYTRPNLPFEADYNSNVKLPDILRQYGATVERVVFKSGQRGTFYDAEAGYLAQGVHQLLEVPAKFHETVDTWLRLLGGDDPERFLDWCAAAGYTTDQPIAALYIEGPGGIGKSLFANGIASMFGVTPVDYSKVTGSFNGGLLQSPVLFADEGITLDSYTEAAASEVFRNYVANVTHSINAKFSNLSVLQGALRVIIAANDENGIPFTKSIGADGIEAIIERILKIKTDHQPRAYLDSIGARNGGEIDTWILPGNRPGKIAEHLAWLRQNRKLGAHQGRFLVGGRRTAWHTAFAIDQGIKPAVLSVIYRLTQMDERVARGRMVKVRVDQEAKVVWIHHQVVSDWWKDYADIRKPKPTSIANAIEQLAAGERKPVKMHGVAVRATPIPFDAFYAARLCEPEDLEDLNDNQPSDGG